METEPEGLIIYGGDFLEDVPHQSFGKTVYDCLRLHCNQPIAMVDSTTRKTVSYKEVFEKSLRLSQSLKNIGVQQNEIIGISSENSVRYVFPLVAAWWLGATVTPFNPWYTENELLHVASLSKPSILFCSKISLEVVLKLRIQLQSVKRIIILDSDDEGDYVESLDNFIASNSQYNEEFVPVNNDPHDVALIVYSSGTTGLQKGVLLTHANLNTTYIIFRDPRFFRQIPPGSATVLGFLPFFHIYGLGVLIMKLILGYQVIAMPKFEGKLFLKLIQDYKVTSLLLVPSIVNFLTSTELLELYDVSHVEEITSGAAPLSAHTQELLIKRLNNVNKVQQGYGLTETSFVVVMDPIGSNKVESIGKLIPGTFAKVIDIDTGKSMGHGYKGELCFKGKQIMKGYLGDPISSKNAFDVEGWFKTGDVGYYDSFGYIYVVDRLKEIIKYKGFQVAPAELEGILLQHPQIADAGVVGLQDEQVGELPLAFVVRKSNTNVTEQDVKEFVANQVTHYKQLRGGVRFIQQIPRNPSGKILRRKLQELLKEAMCCGDNKNEATGQEKIKLA